MPAQHCHGESRFSPYIPSSLRLRGQSREQSSLGLSPCIINRSKCWLGQGGCSRAPSSKKVWGFRQQGAGCERGSERGI